MSTDAITASSPLNWHFVLRRLHSLSGIVPVGLFVIVHLATNFQMLVGDYQHEVMFIHSMPALVAIEVFLWTSIAFHAGLGIVYTFAGARPNAMAYRNSSNWRYTLQRVTGIIALVFIFFHIATLRWRWEFFGLFTPFYAEGPNGEPLATASAAAALQASGWIVAGYLIGSLSVVYHWVNGLWTAAITWGLTISTRAQQWWGKFCLILGIVLTIFTIGGIVGGMGYTISEEEWRAIEATAGRPVRVVSPAPDAPATPAPSRTAE